MKHKDIALIPAYQPKDVLDDLVQKLDLLGFFVIIVDDGSGKAYQGLFDRCGQWAKVLHLAENAGKGRALKTGLCYIMENCEGESIVVTVDADGQHDVEDVLAVCSMARENPGIIVLGSRKLKENVPLRSRFGNAVTRMVYRLSTGQKVHDTQTGLRAFAASMIPTLISIPGERYEYEMNVLLYCAREKMEVREREIKTIYIDHNSGSHFDMLRDSVRIYKEILKFSLSSLIGFFLDYGIYSLLVLVTENLLLSNIAARMVSASVNFTINRRFVFHKKGGTVKAAVEYFLLAASILILNTALLELMVNAWGVHPMLGKILTEISLFFFSWLVQKFVIFRKERCLFF